MEQANFSSAVSSVFIEAIAFFCAATRDSTEAGVVLESFVSLSFVSAALFGSTTPSEIPGLISVWAFFLTVNLMADEAAFERK